MVVESCPAFTVVSLPCQRSLDRIISSNITAVAFGVFTDETSGFSVRIVLFTVFKQSTVGGLVISQFLSTRRITGAHSFRMIGVLSRFSICD